MGRNLHAPPDDLQDMTATRFVAGDALGTQHRPAETGRKLLQLLHVDRVWKVQLPVLIPRVPALLRDGPPCPGRDAEQHVNIAEPEVRVDDAHTVPQARERRGEVPQVAIHGGGGQWTRYVSGRPDWIASGKIYGKKINNLWRVPTSEIRRMLTEG